MAKTKAVDIKAEVKKATAPKKGTAAEVASAEKKGTALRAKQTAKKGADIKSIMSAETKRNKASAPTPLKQQSKTAKPAKTRDVSSAEVSKMNDRAAKKTAPPSAGKIAKATGKMSAKMTELMRVGTSGRGRKADPNSARQQKLAAKTAKIASGGEVKRGRPRSQESIAREQELTKHREARAAEGKSSRGRKSVATSRRSVRKVKAEKRAVEVAKPIEQREGAKTSHSMRPSEVKSAYPKMEETPQHNPMERERGLHKRGKTTVTYASGGTAKYQRRTFTFQGRKKGDSATVHVMRHLRQDQGGADSYKKFHSYRQMDTKDRKMEESVKHSSDPSRTRKVRFTKTRSAAGVEHEKMETSTGRKSTTPAVRGKRGGVLVSAKPRAYLPSMGASQIKALDHQKDSPSGHGRGALRATHAMSSNGTQHRSFDVTTPKAPGKVPLTREVARLPKSKVKSMRGKSGRNS